MPIFWTTSIWDASAGASSSACGKGWRPSRTAGRRSRNWSPGSTPSDREEQFYNLLLGHVKDRIRSLYSRFSTRAEQEILRTEVQEELRSKGHLSGELPAALFRNVVVDIKKEAIYLHNLLPRIIVEKDAALREDFLENSGLDRFYVEEIEREYCEGNGLGLEELYQIRKGLAA